MTAPEKFCLKWNEFQENTRTTFGSLREDTDFADVTLACEEGQQVESHKVILAAASPFFQNLLRKNKHAHPLIYMRGMKSEDLMAIVDFLYYGQVNIYQDNLDSFLAIAEELKLKGLSGGSSRHVQPAEPPQTVIKQKQTQLSPSKEKYTFPEDKIYSEVLFNEQKTTIESSVAIKSETFTGGLKENSQRKIMTYSDETINSMWVHTKKDGVSTYVCQVCGKNGKFSSQIRDHIEVHHMEGVSHPCNFCEKTFRARGSLMVHRHRNHKSA